MINEYFMRINRIWWPRYATARHMTTFNFQNMTVLFRILCKLHCNSRDIKNKSAIRRTHAGRNLTQCWWIDIQDQLHHCRQYLQSQTPTISKHHLHFITVSGLTQSNKLVYWKTRIVWIIENIFWSDQWPWTNNKLWKINKKLWVICRKSLQNLILASGSGPNIRMTRNTGEEEQNIFAIIYFDFVAASLTVCQQTEVFTTPPNIAGCKEGG